MTAPSPRARRIAEELRAWECGRCYCHECREPFCGHVMEQVARALDAEREACTEAAWDHLCQGGYSGCDCRGEIISAIRALADEEERG